MPPKTAPHSMPPMPDANAPLKVQRDALATLLEWLSSDQLLTLLSHGFTTAEVFQLRRIAAAYRGDRFGPEHYKALQEIIAKLEIVQTIA